MIKIVHNNSILYLIYCTFIFFCPSTYGQIPEIIWQQNYGGNAWDQANAIKQTPDGGYIIAGYTLSADGDVSENNGLSDYWVVKLDNFGLVEWQKTYGGSNYDYCHAMELVSDGGYILVGRSLSTDGDVTGSHGGNDYWIVKIDALGNIEWQKCLGGSQYDSAHGISQTADGGYIIIGESQSNDGDVSGHHGPLTGDYWVVKINALGDIEWQNSFGSNGVDDGKSVIQTSDGGYIITGYSTSTGGDVTENNGFADYWIAKLGSEGELIWEKSFGGSNDDISYDITKMQDGGFLAVGETFSEEGDITGFHGGISDCWLVKIDSLGNKIWEKTFGGSDGESFHSICPTYDNGFVLAGLSASFDGDLTENKGNTDDWIIKIDSVGSTEWQKSIGGSNIDVAFSAINASDTNYLVAGYSKSSDFDLTENNGDFDFWVVKLAVCKTQWYADLDGDGFGTLLIDSVSCNMPIGFVSDSTDCNDTMTAINPTAKDICNSIDDNCNGEIDENATFEWWFSDEDNDDFGNANIDSLSCYIVEGYVTDSSDCDDTNPNIYPGATEILNGLDDDCDGFTDEDLAINEIILNSIHIYPNPTDDILHIDYFGNEEIYIEVVNITGQILFSDKIISPSNEINMRTFAPGMYVLRIYAGEKAAAVTFEKQ